jgi:hypothetical protein
MGFIGAALSDRRAAEIAAGWRAAADLHAGLLDRLVEPARGFQAVLVERFAARAVELGARKTAPPPVGSRPTLTEIPAERLASASPMCVVARNDERLDAQ